MDRRRNSLLGFTDAGSRDRVLFALLDGTAKPLRAWAYSNSVQLYGDNDRSEAHRLDDLIVRLYWLIYRNTRQSDLS